MLTPSSYTPSEDQRLAQVVKMVRTFMRDHPQLNRLTRGEESSNRMIAWAVLDCIDDFNTTPPEIGTWTVSTFPSMHLLLRGTVVNLLTSVGLLNTRNAIAFTDGGFSYNTDKSRAIMAWIQLISNEYEHKKLRLKASRNIRAGWGGGIHSEYIWYSHGWYGGWES